MDYICFNHRACREYVPRRTYRW